MKKKTKPFSRILVDHIFENYQEKSFSSIELESFGKLYGKSRQQISQVFLEMKHMGKLEIVGEIPKLGGGPSVKIYQIVEDADFTFIPPQERVIEWRKAQVIKEKKQTDACLRLCKALDIMTASR